MRLPLALAVLAVVVSGCNNTKLAPAPIHVGGPTAVIVPEQSTYAPLDTDTFDGSQSTAVSPNTIASYDWTVVNAPSGSQSQLMPTGSMGETASFFVDLAGDYTIKLTVHDSAGAADSTTYSFSAVPSQSLHVELLWPAQYGQVDMDLHLVFKSNGGTMWDLFKDCYYANCKPSEGGVVDWGAPDTQFGVPDNDDPTLDIDNITGNTPENINIKSPVDGTYAACVHYYASHVGSDITTNDEVRIYVQGTQVFDQTKNMTATNQVWYVGDIACTSGNCTVTPNGALNTTPGDGSVGNGVCGN